MTCFSSFPSLTIHEPPVLMDSCRGVLYVLTLETGRRENRLWRINMLHTSHWCYYFQQVPPFNGFPVGILPIFASYVSLPTGEHENISFMPRGITAWAIDSKRGVILWSNSDNIYQFDPWAAGNAEQKLILSRTSQILCDRIATIAVSTTGNVYWTHTGDNLDPSYHTVWRCNLDGSNPAHCCIALTVLDYHAEIFQFNSVTEGMLLGRYSGGRRYSCLLSSMSGHLSLAHPCSIVYDWDKQTCKIEINLVQPEKTPYDRFPTVISFSWKCQLPFLVVEDLNSSSIYALYNDVLKKLCVISQGYVIFIPVDDPLLLEPYSIKGSAIHKWHRD